MKARLNQTREHRKETDTKQEDQGKHNHRKGHGKGKDMDTHDPKKDNDQVKENDSLTPGEVKKGITERPRCMSEGITCCNHPNKSIGMEKITKSKDREGG